MVAIHSLICQERACSGIRGFLCLLHRPSTGPVPSKVRCVNVEGKHTGISSQTIDEETEAEGGEKEMNVLFHAYSVLGTELGDR